METNFLKQQNQDIKLINEKLYSYVDAKDTPYDVVKQAMLYSLSAGGKRIRPMLTLEFCRASGGDINKALPLACAVEMIHCYSLIHDDLPCMDDDDMRRGKPSCHKKFGEANALLAGDSLLTLSFNTIANANTIDGTDLKACLLAVKALSGYAGVDGMVGGQVMDLINENKIGEIDKDTLYKTYSLKTSALICSAIELGMLSANASKEDINNAVLFGHELGIAFQIIDDILDVTSDEKTLGKPIGSDALNEKNTFVSLYTLEGAKKLATQHTQKALKYLKKTKHSSFLIKLTNSLLTRIK